MFKLISSLALFAGLAFAQSGLNLTCPSTAAVGSLTCSLNLSGTLPVALQFTVVVPSQASGFTATTSIAGKTLSCVANGICLLYGGSGALPASQVATIVFQIPKSSKGANLPNCANCITVGLSSSIAVDANAALVPSTVNPFLSVSMVNPCDVTGDGLTTAADIAAIVSQIQKISPANADLNSDGAVDVLDLQIEVNAVATGVCNAK